ncbi:MAG TPA: dTDP-4-amino-4,6-dideoxygalactose transaminase [Pseudoxanthomonas sp.]|jgi:dTDP-4-amino-4,6-dideoxygalactose transaminase|uniref:dTDP-4-amino-4,6-dideoxygalactose transaminase n=1 Tax=Thermomonas sp. XSG TaxID=2771436 RepID=UPI00086C4D06|nr:dTDP-4-amino-4,6-dideoxygalactose transaminase [Thermomonas sp. XSG]ODU53252.1 MAG: dTDP-4-amino-4,6-dideoxygalactose transaminase [Xanthomonadaceae bacterium SCN 69-48]QNU15390.1 dTDP-4-amino-4,6-dideoxygalactose transaminase [Thermomonas sp. XSG]
MIPFNKPFMTGRELWLIAQAHANGHLSGDGQFTKRSHAWLEQRTGARRALLTHSCTAALEMSALLLDLQPGDEVIMPSYTFVSTANAFVLRGAVPVFVDVREDTLNLDERLVEAAITPRTRAICVVHYAGVACEMDTLLDIAARHGLAIVEDAAQAIMSSYRGRPLGTIGDLGALSFHETKNIISGEGGALLCRDEHYAERSEILREKGTNRSRFFRGQVDKYTWVDVGSSFLPGEITAAFLCAQMEEADQITARRLAIWERYHAWAASYEAAGRLRRPVVPAHCTHNAHMYYLLLPSLEARTHFIHRLKEAGVQTVFHYIPLHSSPAGRTLGRTPASMAITDDISERLVRLPLWVGVEEHIPAILEAADDALHHLA